MILTASEILYLVRKVGFPTADQATMVAIALAESGGDIFALNTSNANGTEDRGLFQINSVHGYNSDMLFDAEFNTRAALNIFNTQGLTAWAAYNNGSYLMYMDLANNTLGLGGTAGVDKAEPPGGYQYKVNLAPRIGRLSPTCTRNSYLIPQVQPDGSIIYTTVDADTGSTVTQPVSFTGTGGVGVSSIDAIIRIMEASGIPHRVTSTYRSTSTTYHGTYNAVDFAGPAPGEDTPELARIAAFWATYGPGTLEIIYSGNTGAQYWKNGVRVSSDVYAGVLDAHHNHVHIAATLDSLSSYITALPASDPSTSLIYDDDTSRASGDVFLKMDTKNVHYEGSNFANGLLVAY